jgi:hypothetical protein
MVNAEHRQQHPEPSTSGSGVTLPPSSNLSSVRRFSHLSTAGKLLVSTMHCNQFGRFENLGVRNGEPVFDPATRLIRVKRIGSAEEPGVSISEVWLLKEPILHLLQELSVFWNGTVERLEFRRGLPCLIEFAIPATLDSERGGKGKEV